MNDYKGLYLNPKIDSVQQEETKWRKNMFEDILEEACRQWCDCIDDAPERKTGTGFANFFNEIFEIKVQEYLSENSEVAVKQVHTEDAGMSMGGM